jgi:hypothetical protein
MVGVCNSLLVSTSIRSQFNSLLAIYLPTYEQVVYRLSVPLPLNKTGHIALDSFEICLSACGLVDRLKGLAGIRSAGPELYRRLMSVLSCSLKTPTIRRWKDKRFPFTVFRGVWREMCWHVEQSNSKSEIWRKGKIRRNVVTVCVVR